MIESVFAIPSSEYEKLKKVLEANPYEQDSFARVGYTVREAKSLGLDRDGYVLYFKAEEELSKKLVARLKETLEEKVAKATAGKQVDAARLEQISKGLEASVLKDLVELSGEEKDQVISRIKNEEDNAASGFGAIFGT